MIYQLHCSQIFKGQTTTVVLLFVWDIGTCTVGNLTPCHFWAQHLSKSLRRLSPYQVSLLSDTMSDHSMSKKGVRGSGGEGRPMGKHLTQRHRCTAAQPTTTTQGTKGVTTPPTQGHRCTHTRSKQERISGINPLTYMTR